MKISQSQNVQTRAFRSAEGRNEHIRLVVYKCEGLYIFYKVWIAAKILDITKDEMKLLVKDRVRPVDDIVYRCFSLAFNCKYISFAREGSAIESGKRCICQDCCNYYSFSLTTVTRVRL